MKRKIWLKVLSVMLVLATLVTTLPLTVFAEEVKNEESESTADELYIKSVKLAQADTAEEAKEILAKEGYTLLDGNLNEGTGKDGIWLGYQTTTDPSEAIYDMKVMNMKGGFTLTNMKDVIAERQSAFAEMIADLNMLIDGFVKAYREGSVPAEKAYKALNFFRTVDGETELNERNGLGYQLVHGGMSDTSLTELLMLCDQTIVDSIIKILTMGIQLRNDNWIEQLSNLGPYTDDSKYGEDADDEEEIKRRAEQLVMIISIYAQSYVVMDKSGLIPDKLDENLNPVNEGEKESEVLTTVEASLKKADESRYKLYKIAFDELAKYQYGTKTVKDFIISINEDTNIKELYPLVACLSDEEFAALSYGCFLEVVTGADAKIEDFDYYDELFEEITKDVKSIYLYTGVNEALMEDDTVFGFTDEASRYMSETGELEFYEKESAAEDAWETGKYVAMGVAAAGLAIMGVAKITMGVTMLVGLASATVATSIKTGILCGVMKFCAAISGIPALAIVALVVLVIVLIALWIAESLEDDDINWDKNPMVRYMYDVKEVSITQTSDDGISTEYIRRPVYTLYETVTDIHGEIIDLNAFSGDATQWLQLFVSYDRQGDDAKPIKATDLLVKTGNGVTPEGYEPLTLFGEVVAYNLNQWDGSDSVNGVYLFYKQDKEVAVESGVTYYIREVFLQSGESDAHCINLLEAAGYTPINVNLTPALKDDDIVFKDKVCTYLGYTTTTNENNAIRDLRIAYGSAPGEVKYGEATYAECGSNGTVTLYATKYKSAGTPLLAGGLVCVNDRDDAPLGSEPVNLFSGGPAASFNIGLDGVPIDQKDYFIYFLPKTTFTGGKAYLGGVAFMTMDYMAEYYADESYISDEVYSYLKKRTGKNYSSDEWDKAINDYIFLRTGYHYSTAKNSDYDESVLYYQTYNPYRAIYDIMGNGQRENTSSMVYKGLGYVSWGKMEFDYIQGLDHVRRFHIGCDTVGPQASMQGIIYLSGNISSENIFVEKKDPNNSENMIGEMAKQQPIRIEEFLCLEKNDDQGAVKSKDSVFSPVTDMLTDSGDAVTIHHYLRYAESSSSEHKREFKFYILRTTDQKKYVSAITAVDELTLFRAYGASDAGLTRDKVTDAMLISQLASQGATNFLGVRIPMRQAKVYYDPLIKVDWMNEAFVSYKEINATKFGYTRTDEASKALRDVFFYVSGFSTDAPPKEIYRGKTKYTLICEIPYNLTEYKDAPKPGVYLYGTTDSKAGNRITDIEITTTPFLEGYETVRTMNGRSLSAEATEYMQAHSNMHFFEWAKELYVDLMDFFKIYDYDGLQENGLFYIHVKREGDDLRKQEPYIGELYLSDYDTNKDLSLDELFDRGADGYVDVDLNKGAGGDYILLGYKYTADPADAIKEVRALHSKSHSAKMTDDDGREFMLVDDLDVNKEAGGDYIYLYATKDSPTADPITSVTALFKTTTGTSTGTFHDGKEVTYTTHCTKKWDSNTNSDLNKWAGGKYIYLIYETVNSTFKGTYKEPKYGKDKTYSRDPYEDINADGEYIGGVYVMDKNTIRQEKLAAGVDSSACTCDKITDEEVIDRLKAMGASTVLTTPIVVSNDSYGKNNSNKVFIGYSRTDKLSEAIRGLALKAEILMTGDPKEKIDVNGNIYKVVAEAAEDVTVLPRPINLIGLEDAQDMVLPRLYLYYSKTANNDPIYDIKIDNTILIDGWNTVISSNNIDPFIDIYNMSRAEYEKADKDDWDTSHWEQVYSDSLFEWMDEVSGKFKPSSPKINTFYIHVRRYQEGEKLEQLKPYIGDVFVAMGGNEREALANLSAYQPDGYVNVNLNKDAGGKQIFLGYKRVEKAKDALRDFAIFQGKKYEPTKRIDINGESVKYTLVSEIDLNKDAGGKYLYLYSADSKDVGNPITGIAIEKSIKNSLVCGVENVTVRLADIKKFTDEYIDLNKGADGAYLYMIMERETIEGHNLGEPTSVTETAPSCGEDGLKTTVAVCKSCSQEIVYEQVLKATGKHIERVGDHDHKCDECGKRNVSEHTVDYKVEYSVDEKKSTEVATQKIIYFCTECEEVQREYENEIPISEVKDLGINLSNPVAPGLASVFSDGSVITISSFVVIAVLAAIIVYLQKKQNATKKNEEA